MLPATMVPGGLSETKSATPEVQHIVDQVKAEFERRENRTFDIFQAIVYRAQVVAGINYFIKVQISDFDTGYAHLRVFEALPQKKQGPSLVSYQTGKTRDDPLDYF
ncbi:cystatin-A-like isoform X1 [Aythya fuligula]|uniref:Cystatin-A-like isoform X1 n=1 Tax=Aythya fuligula TaxID=219594 RepID=A0A6J3EKQ6_AYTFU|nr:cystatin-A-like isoform X1 [Aythya fuligula]